VYGSRVARLIHLALEEVRRVEREHERALVVQHAAADEIALAARHVEGVDRPAESLGDDVRVGDGRDLAVGRARKVGVAYVAVALVGIQPQPLRDAERGHERIMASLAPRHTRTRRLGVSHGANPHQRADVLDRVLPYLVDVGVDLLLELLVRHASSISRVVVRDPWYTPGRTYGFALGAYEDRTSKKGPPKRSPFSSVGLVIRAYGRWKPGACRSGQW
jgi:hypothetical protein